MGSKGFIVALNILATVIYLSCLFMINRIEGSLLFRVESLFFCLSLTVTFPILFFIRQRWKYLILFFLRFIMLFILYRIISEELLLPIITLPSLFEVALFLPPRLSLPLCGAINVHLILTLFLKLEMTLSAIFTTGEETQLILLATITIFYFLLAPAMILMVFYREKVVELNNSGESLSGVVSNIMQNNMKLQYFAVKEGAKAARAERQFITREIHDCVGYALSNTSMVLNGALLADESHEKDELIHSARDMTNTCLQETRSILHRLRLPEIELSDSLLTIKKLLETFEGATGIEIEFHTTNYPLTVDEEIKSAFYRFIQVGLVNSFTHGRATKIRIIMGMDNNLVYVLIWDNGKGIPQNFKKGIGLTGMTERMNHLGGTLAMNNCVDGFEIRASVPLNHRERA